MVLLNNKRRILPDMDKRFMSILAAIIIIFVGIFVAGKGSDNQSSTSSSSGQASNHIIGQGQKGVTLVEYGDYECSICNVFYPAVKQAVQTLSNDIYFQFSNLPLVQLHQNAYSSARAAEAAGLQGKFWEMHDKLYENQDPTGQKGWVASKDPLTIYSTFAQEIGINVDQFKQDFASSKVNDTINADLAQFKKTGRPEATPTFFLDGQPIDNANLFDSNTQLPSADKLIKVIQDEIAKKSKN